MFDLYFAPTPNGWKITIMLEECSAPYNVVPVNLGAGDQFKPEFLRISPNNRMPVLVDHEPTGGGEPISVFESGSIMMYLAEKYGRFWPQDVRGKYEVNQWVVWQMANQGPKTGERGHFSRVDPKHGDQAYAQRRFNDEVHRMYGVLNNRLYNRPWIAGDDYSIADMIAYPWTATWELQGIDMGEFKYFKRWWDAMAARPAVVQGMAVVAGPPEDPATVTPEERARRMSLLYNQRARPAPTA